MIAALLTGFAESTWIRAALRYGAIVVAVLLFLLSLRRSGERAGRLAERLETTQAHEAEELNSLPDGSAIAEMLSDYAVLRDQARACKTRA